MQTLLKKELCLKSIELIEDIVNELKYFGEEYVSDIYENESDNSVVMRVKNGDTIEYSVSEVSCFFTDSFDGLWKNGDSIEECIDNLKKCEKKKYENLSRDEFIEYSGKLNYLELYVNETLNKLREFEKSLQ